MEANPSNGSTRRAYGALAILTLIYVFAYADRFMMAILLQPIKTELQLSDSALGLLTGFAFFVFYAAAAIPLGRLADRVNRRNLLAASLGAWSVATVACGAAGSFVQLALARMAVGIGEGGCAPASHSLISDFFSPGRRALPISIFSAGGTLGMFGGFAAGGWLEAQFGWRGAFIALGAAGVLVVPLILWSLPEPRTGSSKQGVPPTALRELLSTPGFLLIVSAYSFMTLGMLGVTQWLPAFYERSFHLERLTIGNTLATVGGIGAILGLLIGGWLSDRGSRRSPHWPLYQFVAAALIAAPLQLGMLWVSNSNASFFLAFASTLVVWMASSPAFALIQTIVPPGARATATGCVLVGSALIGMGGGPFLAGILSDVLDPTLGSESLRWALAIIVCISGAAVLVLGSGAIYRLGRDAVGVARLRGRECP
jgi:predicted MFS family arabinose efflux permease